MSGINTVTVSGRFTRDVELRHTPNGHPVANVGLAHNERRKGADGQYADVAHFFDITIWGGFAELCAKKLEKGSEATVTGRLNYQSWEADDGSKRSKVEIVAQDIVCADLYKTADADDGPSPTPKTQTQIPDDDIPF